MAEHSESCLSHIITSLTVHTTYCHRDTMFCALVYKKWLRLRFEVSHLETETGSWISRSILLWLETEDEAAIRRRPESERWMMKTIMFQGFHMASGNSCPALIVLVFCLVHSISGEQGARVADPPLITAWGMIGEGSLPAVRAETYCLSPG